MRLNLNSDKGNTSQNKDEMLHRNCQTAVTSKTGITSVREDAEKREQQVYPAGGNVSLWKTARRFLKKLRPELPYDAAIPLLGIYPKMGKHLLVKHGSQDTKTM